MLLGTCIHSPNWMCCVLPGREICGMRKTGLARLVALPQTCGFLMFGKTSKLEQEHPGCFKTQGMFSFPGLAYFSTCLRPSSAVPGSRPVSQQRRAPLGSGLAPCAPVTRIPRGLVALWAFESLSNYAAVCS